jgi:hypothetical protein
MLSLYLVNLIDHSHADILTASVAGCLFAHSVNLSAQEVVMRDTVQFIKD